MVGFFRGCHALLRLLKISLSRVSRTLLSQPCTHPPALNYGKLSQYTHEERSIVTDRWLVKDYDLAVEILDLPTRDRPRPTTAEVATPFADALMFGHTLEQLHAKHPNHSLDALGEMTLFQRVIEKNVVQKTMERVGGPDETAKAALDRLVSVSDALSSNSPWARFESLQDTLVPIRLAGRFTTDGPRGTCLTPDCRVQRQLEALDEFKLLYGQGSGVSKVIRSRFLTDVRLMTSPGDDAVVTAERVATTLDTMRQAMLSSAQRQRSYRGTDRNLWTESPDWWEMSKLSSNFSYNGSATQAQAAFEWLAITLGSGDVTPDWMVDSQLLQALKKAPGNVDFELLASYADRRDDKAEKNYTKGTFLADLISKAQLGRWHAIDPSANDKIVKLVSLSSRSFHVFADLIDLEAKGRTPLSSGRLAGELNEVVEIAATKRLLHPPVFEYALANVVKRNDGGVLKRGLEARKSASQNISSMIRSFESALEHKAGISFAAKSTSRVPYDVVVGGLNGCREISDFAGPPGDDIVTALRELFDATSKANLRKRIYCCYPNASLESFIRDRLLPKATDVGWVPEAVRASFHGTSATLAPHALAPSEKELIRFLFGDGEAFFTTSAHDPFTKTVAELLGEAGRQSTGSWLFDEYVIRVAKTSSTLLEHSELTRYAASRKPNFVSDLLRRAEKVDVDVKMYYSGHRPTQGQTKHCAAEDRFVKKDCTPVNLDVLFEVAPLTTHKQVTADAATIARILTEQVCACCNFVSVACLAVYKFVNHQVQVCFVVMRLVLCVEVGDNYIIRHPLTVHPLITTLS